MPGVPLPSAYKVKYDTSFARSSAAGGGGHQPRTTPIAHFASVPPSHPTGSLLDANSSYIVYAVKGGLVRVIDRRGALRTLLRGHNVRVSDVSFCGNVPGGSNADVAPPPKPPSDAAGGAAAAPPQPAGSDLLATVGGAGDDAGVLIWRIVRRDAELAAEKLLEVRFRPAARVIWHPFNPNQILLLHGEGDEGADDEGGDDEGGAAAKCSVAATLVDTVRLSTVPHEEGGHQVCLCGAGAGAGARGGDPPPKAATNDGAGGSVIEGTVRLVVPGTPGAAANDLCWSPTDARHVLTAHVDGVVRLWDLRGRTYVDAGSGAEVPGGSAGLGAGGAAPEGALVSASISSQVAVCAEGGADRCQFLPEFADAAPEGAGGGSKEALTPPFITGHKSNAAVTLWSAFPVDGSAPSKVAVFELASPRPLKYSLAACDAGNALRPSDPSTFALLADDEDGGLYALRLRTGPAAASAGGKPAAIASGFDSLLPFRLAHPILSWTVGTSPAGRDDDAQGLVEEGDADVNLFVVQSRAVQMLTIPPGMRGAPAGGTPPGMLAEGVSVEERPEGGSGGAAAAAMVTDDESGVSGGVATVEYDDYDDDEDMREEEDEDEDEEEEESDDDGGGGGDDNHGPPASSLPPPGLSPDLKPSRAAPAAAPPGVGSGEGAFANWLGSLAGAGVGSPPLPAATGAPERSTSAASTPPVPPTPHPTPAQASYKPLVAVPPGMVGPPPGMPAPPPGMGGGPPAPAPPPGPGGGGGGGGGPTPLQPLAAALEAEAKAKAGNVAGGESPTSPTDEEDDEARDLVTRSGSGFLSPMEILQSAKAAGGAKRQDRGAAAAAGGRAASAGRGGKKAAAVAAAPPTNNDLDKAVGALPAGGLAPVPPSGTGKGKKEPTPKRSGRSSRPRGGGKSKSKSPARPKSAEDRGGRQPKKSRTPLKGGGGGGGAAGPAPGADGKIAILKREERPLGGAPPPPLPEGSPAPAPAAGIAAPAAAPAPVAASVSSADVEESVRRSLSTHFRQHTALLLAEVSKAVKSEVESTVAPALDRAVEGSLDRAVTRPLSASIAKSTKDAYKVRTREVVEGVSAEVGGKVVEAFHKSMREVMIPAYEAATRQVFSQVSSAVQSGLAAQAQRRSRHDAEMMELMKVMSTKMDAMSSAIESLTAEVAQLKAAGGAAAAAAGAGAGAGAAEQADRSRATRDEILSLLRVRDYEAAFTRALSASDGEIAVFACRNADLPEVLEGSTPALSQPILLCLMQQLGAVLASTSSESDLRVEVAWLQDIAVTIDPNDDSIGRHVGGVLRQLVANLNAKMAQGGLDPTLRRPLQMLLQVIRGMGVAT